MTYLDFKLFNSINDNNKEQICLYADELKEKLGNDIINTMVKIFDYKTRETSDFHYDFLLHICVVKP